MAIHVNVLGAQCSTVESPPFFGRNEEQLQACTTAWIDQVTGYQASVNGRDVGDLAAYRTTSPPFTINVPEHNVLGVDPGVAQAVSEDYGFIVAPRRRRIRDRVVRSVLRRGTRSPRST